MFMSHVMRKKMWHIIVKTSFNLSLAALFHSKAFEEKNPTAWSHIPCFAPVAFFNIAGADGVDGVDGDVQAQAREI